MRKLLVLLLLSVAVVLPAKSQTAHSVTLTWVDPNNPTGTQYNAYRASGACATGLVFSKLNTAAPISGLTFADTTVTLGSTYCYQVTAVSGTIESLPSPQAGAMILPFSPASLTITAK